MNQRDEEEDGIIKLSRKNSIIPGFKVNFCHFFYDPQILLGAAMKLVIGQTIKKKSTGE